MYKILKTFCGVLFIFFHCAHQVPPSGGPEDSVSPYVLKTIPASGTCNHPVDQSILFYFSEWIAPLPVKKSLTILPPLPDGYEIVVTKRMVEIKPKKAFSDSTTYHINVSSDLTDQHGVSIGGPYTFFFSTGSYIDSGSIYGCIVDTALLTAQPRIALFQKKQDQQSDTAMLALPTYLVQTDTTGFFWFEHLREGDYYIAGFIDKDNSRTLTPGVEPAFAPLQPTVHIGKEQSAPLLLYPTASDTATNTVISFKAVSPRVVTGEWKNFFFNSTIAVKDISIVSRDTYGENPKINRYFQVKGSPQFVISLSDTLTNGPYSFIYTPQRRFDFSRPKQDSPDSALHNTDIGLLDTIRFNGTTVTDTILPVMKGSSPLTAIPLNKPLELLWSEPVQIMTDRWYVTDTLQDTIFLSVDTAYSERTVFTPIRRFLPDRQYTFSLPVSLIQDITNNNPHGIYDSLAADSGRHIQVVFTTVEAKSLCYRLEGSAQCLDADSLRLWQFQPLRTQMNHTFTVRDMINHFQFDSLPSSLGTVRCFTDSNRDRQYSPGSLFPWQAPESYTAFSDTIEARARWEIEGIILRDACEQCSLPPPSGADQDSLLQSKENPDKFDR